MTTYSTVNSGNFASSGATPTMTFAAPGTLNPGTVLPASNYTQAPTTSAPTLYLLPDMAENYINAMSVFYQLVLKENDNYLHLLIKDNGQGISKADMAKLNSFGLLGMRERAISLNGELEVEGYPGKGTTITFCAPLQKDASI